LGEGVELPAFPQGLMRQGVPSRSGMGEEPAQRPVAL